MNIIKNLTFAITCISIFQSCAAQNKITVPEISQTDVGRIIKTLSADEMMGRNSMKPEQIAKAADFIASEFKGAGLKYFDGLNTYRQNFELVQSKFSSGELFINGKEIDPEDYALSSTEKELAWESLPKIEHIGKDDNFLVKSQGYLQNDENLIILVDPSEAAYFKRVKAFLSRGGMRVGSSKSASKLFVLGNQEVKTIKARFTNTVSSIPLFNVVGVLPGKSRPNEYVVFSGHYDHLGIIKAVNQDSIANGADDDASGTTAVIELAKYFSKKNDNERTLVFVAFTAEEIGGYGSQYFSKQLNPNQTVAMFNIEMIGKESKFGKNNAFITGYERSDFGKILQRNLEGTGFKFYPDPYPAQNLFYRSDNATLARLGVPAHTISSDQIDTDKLYHSVDDEFETLDVGNITEIIKAIAISSTSIVDGKDTPTRVSGVK
ncbi:M20/M25/M40 family metallo-hydrolase [Pedobacter sp. SD-b]|uniref:M20/M25/M40 family metallo-hydrolase n=1 Tax=Pedobacter segetis TaxID=2793069 RepID=A0ABS1BEX6_9SPHI|nr:M20/M25/M40 family metallo-hydrolase [Pedobacter segetis]MBK0381410.1 M20/M25/M40 family metallo-hydrolase [Pedobacter segetis]